jgi:hypothetical protein
LQGLETLVSGKMLKGAFPNQAELLSAVTRKLPDIRRSLNDKKEKAFQAFVSLGENPSVDELQQLERLRSTAEIVRHVRIKNKIKNN